MPSSESPTPVPGVWILKAQELANCPLHRPGDRLVLQPPAMHYAGDSCCLIPTLKLRKYIGEPQVRQLFCAWQGCKGRWEALPQAPESGNATFDPRSLSGELDDKPFLLQLPQAVATSLIQAGERRELDGDVIVLEKGVANQKLFLVVKGTLEVLDQHPDGELVRVAVIQRGECFGEMSLLTHQPTSTIVRTLTPTQLMVVNRDRFYELLSRYGALGALLNRLLAHRLRTSNQQLEHILRPGIWGNLEVFPFLSVVQSVQAGTMSGLLTITRSRGRAVFGFDQGKLRYAKVGSTIGEDALLEIFRWDTGTFRFQSERLQLDPNIHGDTMAVLLDALRRFDEITHASVSHLDTTILPPPSELAETAWQENSAIDTFPHHEALLSSDSLQESSGDTQPDPLSIVEPDTEVS